MRVARILTALSLGVAALGSAGSTAPADAAAAAPLRIMPLGASNTYGVNSTDGNGYREVLRRHLVDEAGLSIDYVGSLRSGNSVDRDNEGHSGLRIDQIAAGADGWLTTYRPEVVLLNIGTNDTRQDYQLATAPDRLSALVDQILRVVPTATVMMSTLVPSATPAYNASVQAFNAKLPAIAQAKAAAGKKVHLVDLNSVLTLDDIGSDGVHPTDGGYVKIADLWYAALQPALGLGTAGILRGQESGRCADVPGFGQTNGTAIGLWGCNGGSNQRWTATPSGQLSVYGRQCLDVDGRGTADGTKVQIWTCTGANNQRWSVNPDGTVVSVSAGKCLDATGHGTANGTPLQLWTCNGGANQRWARR
ncbi:ricin-type beta-trefoil lectin domain protein [Micromonospora sp. 067-2]|uniref:ricin-type beta-trefoil lectin domain protein n=1 Tax=Micromonospora sp. 067-2 TaxID=2789270 RepID=UPI00397C2444